MKRSSIAALLSLIVVVSCQSKIDSPTPADGSTSAESSELTILTASVEQPVATKSTIEKVESDYKFKWAVGDEISVMTNLGFHKFSVTANPENENQVEFSGLGTAQDGAIYPYNADYEDFTAITLPSSYGSALTPYKVSTNMPMLASLSGSNLNFRHLAGVAAFPIANIPTNASKFVFVANGNKITGNFAISVSGEDKIISTEKSVGDDNSVTIAFQNFASVQESVTFYIPLPTGTYNGFTIKLQDSADKDLLEINSSKSFSITRASLRLFSGLSYINDEPANSYIIPLSNKITQIDIAIVNQFWNSTESGSSPKIAISSESVWIPEIIWAEDANGALSTEQIAALDFKFCSILGQTKTEFTGNVPFYVKTNIDRGMNILIGIHKKGETNYLWSWHLWLTDYNPNAVTPVNGKVHTYNAKSMMDRNLGATITGYNGSEAIKPSENPGIIGLYYQFGRKDPFKTQGTVDKTDTMGQQTRGFATNNPAEFIIVSSSDWCTPAGSDNWNSIGSKSIYDPCPAGWRVPTKDVWTGFSASNFILEGANKGRTYNSMAFYPDSGFRSGGSSDLNGVSDYGYYWSASSSAANTAYCLHFESGSVDSSGIQYRAFAFPVRCCKD